MKEVTLVSLIEGEAIERGVHISQFLIEGGVHRRGCSCRLVFNRKRMPIE